MSGMCVEFRIVLCCEYSVLWYVFFEFLRLFV